MRLQACCAKAAHQTFAGIEMIAFRGHVIPACQRLPKTDSAALMRLSWSASSTPIAMVPSLPPRQIDYATDPSHHALRGQGPAKAQSVHLDVLAALGGHACSTRRSHHGVTVEQQICRQHSTAYGT